MIEKSVAEFLQEAADRRPVPGGGAIAALAAAMGSAMAHMSASYSTSEKFAEVKEQVEVVLAHFREAVGRFAQLAEADAEAYSRFAEAMKMPRSTEAEKQKRKAAMQLAIEGAIEVPLEVCGLCVESLRALLPLVEVGNKNLVSDTGVAAVMLKAGFSGAKLNVETNLAWLADKEKAEEIRKAVEEQEPIVREMAEGIYRRALERMREK
ncbi:MAG: sugar ABC transporter substrate-binding protein [Planctomycetota bacterium]|nr:MAG: sugar ABC transporter substrate-binding protein [Planctomycetota bacterium]